MFFSVTLSVNVVTNSSHSFAGSATTRRKPTGERGTGATPFLAAGCKINQGNVETSLQLHCSRDSSQNWACVLCVYLFLWSLVLDQRGVQFLPDVLPVCTIKCLFENMFAVSEKVRGKVLCESCCAGWGAKRLLGIIHCWRLCTYERVPVVGTRASKMKKLKSCMGEFLQKEEVNRVRD